MKCKFCNNDIINKYSYEEFNTRGSLTTINFCSEACLKKYKTKIENDFIIISILGCKRVPKIISELICDYDIFNFNIFLKDNKDNYKRIFDNKKFFNKSLKDKYFLAILKNNYVDRKQEIIEDFREDYSFDYKKGKQVQDKKTIFDIDI